MSLSSRHHLNVGSVDLSVWPRILHQNPVKKTHKSGEAAGIVTFVAGSHCGSGVHGGGHAWCLQGGGSQGGGHGDQTGWLHRVNEVVLCLPALPLLVLIFQAPPVILGFHSLIASATSYSLLLAKNCQ